jgi:hypothetical protein
VLVPLGEADARWPRPRWPAEGGGWTQTVRRLADIGPALTRLLS